jgi:hypothetical protein
MQKLLVSSLVSVLVAGSVGFLVGKRSSSTVVSKEGSSLLGAVPLVVSSKGTLTSKDLGEKDLVDFSNVERNCRYQLNSLAEDLVLRMSLKPEVKVAELPPLSDLLTEKVSEQEVAKFYEENKKNLPPNTTLEQVRTQVVSYLSKEKSRKVTKEKLPEALVQLKASLPLSESSQKAVVSDKK